MALDTSCIRRSPFLSALAAAILGAACQTPPAGSPASPGQATSAPAEQTGPVAPSPEGGEETASLAAPSPAPVPAPSPADSAVAGGSHVFQVKLPAVGTRALETETDTMSLALSVTPAGATGAFKTDRSEREAAEKVVEVLAVSAEAVTRVKVTYKAHSVEKKEDGADKSKPSPVQGKTFVVEAKGGTVRVSLPSGSAAPADAEKIVAGDFRRLGKPDPMQKALAAGPVQVGARVDAIGDAVKEQLAGADEPGETTTVTKSEVTFSGVRDDGGARVGVFDVALDVQKADAKMVMRLSVKGKVEVSLADGMPVAMSFESPIVVTSDDADTGVKIVGAGRATKTVTRKVQ